MYLCKTGLSGMLRYSSTVDALAVKDSTVNITKATVNTGTFASQNGTLIVDASSKNTLDISGKASGDLRVYSAGSLDLINEQTAFILPAKTALKSHRHNGRWSVSI